MCHTYSSIFVLPRRRLHLRATSATVRVSCYLGERQIAAELVLACVYRHTGNDVACNDRASSPPRLWVTVVARRGGARARLCVCLHTRNWRGVERWSVRTTTTTTTPSNRRRAPRSSSSRGRARSPERVTIFSPRLQRRYHMFLRRLPTEIKGSSTGPARENRTRSPPAVPHVDEPRTGLVPAKQGGRDDGGSVVARRAQDAPS